MNSSFNLTKLTKPNNSAAPGFFGAAPAANTSAAGLFGAAPNTSATGSFFGSFTTLTLLGVLFVLIFVGIYVYFKTIGYTIDMGWDSLMGIFGKKKPVDISLTADNDSVDSVKLVPPPPSNTPVQDAALKSALGLNSIHPEDRPSGMPGARESPGFFSKAANSIERAFDPEKQVFNVSRNLYTYDEASPLCKAMGAELATYEQIQEAHKHGADWCNYGWVKGQMAVYPTQEETWNKLQQGPPEYRGSCGKPGVNGGVFDNPDLRFGVNCYGPRPQKKDTDELTTDTDMGMPPTAEQIEFDKRVQKFRDNLNNITVLPWSRSNWSG